MSDQDVADLCASFQAAVAAVVRDRVQRAMALVEARHPGTTAEAPALVVAGGVAANLQLRGALTELVEGAGWRLALPPLALCTDNAAMVAWAGAEHLARGNSDALDVAARAPLAARSRGSAGAGLRQARRQGLNEGLGQTRRPSGQQCWRLFANTPQPAD